LPISADCSTGDHCNLWILQVATELLKSTSGGFPEFWCSPGIKPCITQDLPELHVCFNVYLLTWRHKNYFTIVQCLTRFHTSGALVQEMQTMSKQGRC